MTILYAWTGVAAVIADSPTTHWTWDTTWFSKMAPVSKTSIIPAHPINMPFIGHLQFEILVIGCHKFLICPDTGCVLSPTGTVIVVCYFFSVAKFVFGSIMETIVLMDELFSVITPQIVAQSYTGVEYDLSISNLGRLDFPIQYGSLCLGAFYGPAIGTNSEEITLGVITIGDKMHFTMTFTDMKITLAQAEEIKEIAMSHLADAAVW